MFRPECCWLRWIHEHCRLQLKAIRVGVGIVKIIYFLLVQFGLGSLLKCKFEGRSKIDVIDQVFTTISFFKNLETSNVEIMIVVVAQLTRAATSDTTYLEDQKQTNWDCFWGNFYSKSGQIHHSQKVFLTAFMKIVYHCLGQDFSHLKFALQDQPKIIL